MKRRIWVACVGLLVAANLAAAQPPALLGPPGVPAVPPLPTETAPPAAPPVAVVGGVPISVAELDAVSRQAEPVPLPLSERQQARQRQRALGMLIDGILMRKFLEANTKPVDPAEVQRRLAQLEADLREKGKSLEEFCRDTNKTVAQLRADLADQIRWSAYEATQLTDIKLIQFYNDYKDFFEGVTVRASHVVIRIPANATDADKAAARLKLEEMRKRLTDDPKLDFDEVAKTMPDKGGDLGPIPRKWLDEPFSRAAFATPKGAISGVVQTDFGMHLIKVTDRKPGRASKYAEMRESVREFCAQDLRQAILARQRKAVEVKVNLP